MNIPYTAADLLRINQKIVTTEDWARVAEKEGDYGEAERLTVYAAELRERRADMTRASYERTKRAVEIARRLQKEGERPKRRGSEPPL